MVEKYLINNEHIVYELDASITLDDDDGFYAYLTNKRLIFLRRTGLIFKKDRFVDMFLKDVIGATMHESGFLFKKRFLELRTNNQNVRVYGNAENILDFHKRVIERVSLDK